MRKGLVIGMVLAAWVCRLFAAQLGEWGTSLSEARQLAVQNDRPILILFWNSGGGSRWSTLFKNRILDSEEWIQTAAEQKMAMVRYDVKGTWNEGLYKQVVSNNTDTVYGYPVFYFLSPDGTEALYDGAFSYRPETNVTDTASVNSWINTYLTPDAFIERLEEVLGEYWLDDVSATDVWDPKDDRSVGATALALSATSATQLHTVGGEYDSGSFDRADWFSFKPAFGSTSRFTIKANLNFSSETLYSTNTSVTVTNRVQEGSAPLQDGTYPQEALTDTPYPEPPSSGKTLDSSTNIVAVISSNAVENVHSVTGSVNIITVPVVNGIFTNTLYSAFLPTNTLPDAVYARLWAEGKLAASTSYWEKVGATVSVTDLVQTASHVAVTNAEVSGSESFSLKARILSEPDPGAMRDFLVYETGVVTNEVSLEESEVTLNLFYPYTEKGVGSRHFLYVAQLGDGSQTNRYRVSTWMPEVTNRYVTATAHRWNAFDTCEYAVASNVYEVIAVSTATSGLARIVTFSTNQYWTAHLVCTSRYAQVAEQVITNQIHTMRASTNEVRYTNVGDAQYRLSYQTWKPGTIGFGAATLKVNESAEKVMLPVKRTGGASGTVRLRYWTEDGSATGWTAGSAPEGNFDFVHQSGELMWPDGGSSTTNLVIDLLQDLRPTWEGEETFTVHLEPVEGADGFQAPLAIDTVTVTLNETARPVAGKLALAGCRTASDDAMAAFANPKKPAFTASAGSTVTLYVAREEGSDGELAAMVVPNDKTFAIAYPDGADRLVWANGVTETLPVTVTVPAMHAAAREVILTVKPAKGTTMATPASVALTVLNAQAVQVSTELADAAPWGITARDTAKAWYWSATGTAQALMGVVEPKKTVTFQLSFAGPGVLRYDWRADGWNAASSWVCGGGVVKPCSYPGGDTSAEILVKAGRQTVTWTVKNNGTSVLSPCLSNLRWNPLPMVDYPQPGNGAQTGSTMLGYTVIPTNTVFIGSVVTAADSELACTEEVYCLSPKPNTAMVERAGSLWEFFDDPDTALKTGTAVSWRVDAVYVADDGTRLARTGAKWGFSLLDSSASETNAPFPENVDVDQDGTFLAYRGIWCDLGDLTAADVGLTYQVRGAMPKGLTLMDKKTGRIGGAPTVLGVFAFEIQATGPDRQPYASRTIRIRVAEPTDGQVDAILAPDAWTPGTDALAGYHVQLAVGTEAMWAFPEAGIEFKVAAGSSPAGLRFATAEGTFSGIPTRAGRSFVTLRVETPRNETVYRTVIFDVLPISAFAGTYSGWVPSQGDADQPFAAGLATLTLSQTGAWSFQATVNGTVKRFSGKGLEAATFSSNSVETVQLAYDELVTMADDEWTQALDLVIDGETRSVAGTLRMPRQTIDSEGEKTVEDMSYTLDGALFYAYGSQKAEQAVIEPFKGYYVAALPVAEFARPTTDEGILFAPQGSGYLTFTVDAKGSVKWSAVLADGNAVSGASPLIFENGTNDVTEAKFFIYGKPSAYGKADGGVCGLFLLDLVDPYQDRTGYALTLVQADPAGDKMPAWWRFDALAVRQPPEGEGSDTPGFFATLNVKGAYYDKVLNLQTYYLGKTLRFADYEGAVDVSDAVTVDTAEPGWFIRTYYADYDGPSGSSGYQLVTESYIQSLDGTLDAEDEDDDESDSGMAEDDWDSFLPFGTPLTLGARSLSVPYKKIVRGQPSRGGAFSTIAYDDLTDDDGNTIAGSGSRNLSSLRLSFTQATGIISGSFELNYERHLTTGAFSQKKRSVPLKGVYIPFYSMAEDALGYQGLGFYLLPDTDAYWNTTGRLQTYSFNYSLPFALESVETE